MRTLEPALRQLPEALALGRALLMRAERDRVPLVAASLVHGPAVVLGAAQRAGRVVDLDTCAHAGVLVYRRTTTGTAAWIGGRAYLFTVALPDVAALLPDATPRTLLNRNVRPLLKGFARAGAIASYFGREWITVRQRPAVLLGFDVSPSGAVLLEALAGHDEPLAIPGDIESHEERALDRWQGKHPAALGELLPGAHPDDIARAVLDGFTQRVQQDRDALVLAPGELDPSAFRPVTNPMDPVPEHLHLGAPVPVPIGWIEAAVDPSGQREGARAWVGGDVLAPRWALERIAERAVGGQGPEGDTLGDIALEGASLSDLLQAVGVAVGDVLG